MCQNSTGDETFENGTWNCFWESGELGAADTSINTFNWHLCTYEASMLCNARQTNSASLQITNLHF